MRRRLADLLSAIALRLYPDGAFFGDLDAVITNEQWASLLILHLEAVHGCEHTDQARREIGLVGPRGNLVDAEQSLKRS
jgi:hypothetical protein